MNKSLELHSSVPFEANEQSKSFTSKADGFIDKEYTVNYPFFKNGVHNYVDLSFVRKIYNDLVQQGYTGSLGDLTDIIFNNMKTWRD